LLVEIITCERETRDEREMMRIEKTHSRAIKARARSFASLDISHVVCASESEREIEVVRQLM
jgi:hypothetical protein